MQVQRFHHPCAAALQVIGIEVEDSGLAGIGRPRVVACSGISGSLVVRCGPYFQDCLGRHIEQPWHAHIDAAADGT